MMRGMRYLKVALAALGLAWALGSCGKLQEGSPLQLDSNTNWLERCDSDAVCSGSLRCYCGQCSQPCAEDDECSLLAGAECAGSGGAVCGEQPSAGGLCVLGCSGDRQCGDDFACTDGQCVPTPCAGGACQVDPCAGGACQVDPCADGACEPTPCSGGLQGFDEVYAEIANDLARQDADDALSMRYLSLANDSNARGCGPVLTVQRAALNKLVNSLSVNRSAVAPVPVNTDLTLYRIDLRDYGWDRVVTVDGLEHADGWEAIVAASPYATPFVGDDADDAVADSGTTIPVLFGDAFVAVASQAPLYYALLGVPQSLDEFLSVDLGIDVAMDRLDDDVVRAGIVGSAVNAAVAESLAERYTMGARPGWAWQIFSELAGAPADPFRDPLGTPGGERELIYTLPNGLHGHVLSDADGQVRAASDVLVDTAENDFHAKMARSYLRRRAQGLQVQDVVRQFALDDVSRFSRAELESILQTYPERAVLQQIQDSDRSAFAEALSAAGVDINAREPVSQAFQVFDANVDLATAAGDLMIDAQELADNLDILQPGMGVLANGGRLVRDDFQVVYLDSLCILSVVNENQPDPSVCDVQ